MQNGFYDETARKRFYTQAILWARLARENDKVLLHSLIGQAKGIPIIWKQTEECPPSVAAMGGFELGGRQGIRIVTAKETIHGLKVRWGYTHECAHLALLHIARDGDGRGYYGDHSANQEQEANLFTLAFLAVMGTATPMDLYRYAATHEQHSHGPIIEWERSIFNAEIDAIMKIWKSL